MRTEDERSMLISACASCWVDHRDVEPLVEWCADSKQGLLVSSGTEYSGIIKHLVYRLKYDRDDIVMHELSVLCLRAWHGLAQHLTSEEIESVVFVPVPLHWKKFLRRGFNQADWLAQDLSYMTKRPRSTKLLRRVKATAAQHGLTRGQRYANISSAFAANSKPQRGLPPNPVIVLVDDLFTSGATLSAAAEAIQREIPVKRVCAIAAARATISAHVD